MYIVLILAPSNMSYFAVENKKTCTNHLPNTGDIV